MVSTPQTGFAPASRPTWRGTCARSATWAISRPSSGSSSSARGRTAQFLNYSSLASDCGISQPTAKAWLSILEAIFLVFRLPPYHDNLRKRLVKTPKLHFLDTGLACWLLGIRSADQLRSHPLRGALFETWIVSEIFKHRRNRGEPAGMSFYRDREGVEADLVLHGPDGLKLVEAKAAQTPSPHLFDGMTRLREQLAPGQATCDVLVAYGGDQAQDRSQGTPLPWARLHEQTW